MSKKINLLYDASILRFGINNDAYRSGLYFVAYNLLRELIKFDELDVKLYCESVFVKELNCFLAKYFPEKNMEIITDLPRIEFQEYYLRLKKLRDDFKKDKKIFKKNILQIWLLIYSLFLKSLRIIHRMLFNYSQIDVYFSPVYVIPSQFRNKKNIKCFNMLHDTIPIICKEESGDINKKGRWYRQITDSFSKKNYYFTNSDSTKRDFLKYYNTIDSNKIYTTLLACNEMFKPATAEQSKVAKIKYGIPFDKKYVFSLCTLDPRKNLLRAVKTFIQFIQKHNIEDLVFVLGGGHWDSFMSVLERELENIGTYRDKIIKVGYVDDEDLAPLFSGAEWMVYTSKYEGFGLPPLEAMSCGCPVITSNNSSLPEVVGDAGLMIDWDSDEQHIEAYEKYYFNINIKKEFAQKGIERSKLFSWKTCAEKIASKIIQVHNEK